MITYSSVILTYVWLKASHMVDYRSIGSISMKELYLLILIPKSKDKDQNKPVVPIHGEILSTSSSPTKFQGTQNPSFASGIHP